MRELTMSEVGFVSGGSDECGNDYGGVTDTSSIGPDLIEFYEGLVSAVSHIIERVANAL